MKRGNRLRRIWPRYVFLQEAVILRVNNTVVKRGKSMASKHVMMQVIVAA